MLLYLSVNLRSSLVICQIRISYRVTLLIKRTEFIKWLLLIKHTDNNKKRKSPITWSKTKMCVFHVHQEKLLLYLSVKWVVWQIRIKYRVYLLTKAAWTLKSMKIFIQGYNMISTKLSFKHTVLNRKEKLIFCWLNRI